MNNNEKLTQFFMIILLVVGIPVLIFCMWAGVDIDDLKCIKGADVCTIYTRKAFQQSHINDFFKISDIVSYRIERRRYSGGRRTASYNYYIPVLIMRNENLIFLNFGTRSYDKAELIAKRIVDNQDFEIKGNYFRTVADRY